MSRNVEIKARLQQPELDGVVACAKALATTDPVELPQDDTFFGCANGRLKLRVCSNSAAELVFYQRDDQHRAGPKLSYYSRVRVVESDALRELLGRAYVEIGRVQKRRIVILAGRTRIHIDAVEDLGTFVELEVVLFEKESPQAGIWEAESMMSRLGIRPAQLVAGAYIDLLAAFHSAAPR